MIAQSKTDAHRAGVRDFHPGTPGDLYALFGQQRGGDQQVGDLLLSGFHRVALQQRSASQFQFQLLEEDFLLPAPGIEVEQFQSGGFLFVTVSAIHLMPAVQIAGGG